MGNRANPSISHGGVSMNRRDLIKNVLGFSFVGLSAPLLTEPVKKSKQSVTLEAGKTYWAGPTGIYSEDGELLIRADK